MIRGEKTVCLQITNTYILTSIINLFFICYELYCYTMVVL